VFTGKVGPSFVGETDCTNIIAPAHLCQLFGGEIDPDLDIKSLVVVVVVKLINLRYRSLTTQPKQRSSASI